jgi:hypothetical protein
MNWAHLISESSGGVSGAGYSAIGFHKEYWIYWPSGFVEKFQLQITLPAFV